MEIISSRKNQYIQHLRSLGSDGKYRWERGEFLCDGYKLLEDAIASGTEITSILWKDSKGEYDCSAEKQYIADSELFDYASPMKNSPGPLFTCRIPASIHNSEFHNAVILEDLQDPGNVGTVLRTANAFGIKAVVLVGACADLYSPKTVRASMGAIFRQKAFCLDNSELRSFLTDNSLKLYGAVLSDRAEDLRNISLENSAVAIGSEGHGLSSGLVSICDGEIIIPMNKCSESLNAAVAASVIMWEMAGKLL